MRSFLYTIIIFSIPIVIVISIMDMYLWNKNSIYKEKINGLEKNAENIEVLILGNSHASYGVDPSGFTMNSYNFANVSQSIYFDRRLTEKYIDKLENLKYVFISIDYHSLNFSKQSGLRNIWSYYVNGIKYKEQSYLKANISPFLFGYTPKVSISMLKDDIIDEISTKFSLGTSTNLLDTINNGFIANTGSDIKVFTKKKYKIRAESFNISYDKIMERNFVLNDIKEFITELKQKNITPILFATPTFSEYNKYLLNDNIKKNELDIIKICNEFNLEYWDYSNSDIFNIDDFYNCDHLNKHGAKKFGMLLNKRLLYYNSEINDLGYN